MLASLGHGIFVSRLDKQSALRFLPFNASDYNLLGYMVQGSMFIDNCLPICLFCKFKV